MSFYIFKRIFNFFAEQHQWDKLYYYLNHYIRHNVIGMFLIICILVSFTIAFISMCMRNKTYKKQWILRLMSLIIYSVALFLLYIVIRNADGSGVREFSLSYYITDDNLRYHESRVLVTLTNVLLFIPFGYWLTQVLKKHRLLRVCIAIVVSCGIEILQLVLGRGFFAMQDIIAYLLGILVGTLVAWLYNVIGNI